MIIGLKDSIPYDQVISRDNNYRNYLSERRDTHLIFYLSEKALIREGMEGGRESFKGKRDTNLPNRAVTNSYIVQLHPRNTKKRDKNLPNRAVKNIYFDNKSKLSTDFCYET